MKSLLRSTLFLTLTLLALHAFADVSQKIDPRTRVYGERYVRIITERNAGEWAKSIDIDALAALAFKDMSLNANELNSAKRGFEKALPRSAESTMLMMKHNRAVPKLVASQPRATGNMQLIRLDMFDEKNQSAGHSYLRLSLDSTGKLLDYRDYTSTEWVSAKMGRFMATTMQSSSFFEKMLGVPSGETSEAVKHVRAYAEAIRQQNFQKALREIRSLPDKYRNQLSIASVELMAAQNVDEATYRASLASFAQRFGDEPEARFLLLDHYFFEKQFVVGARALEKFERDVIEDGATNRLKCIYLGEAGLHEQALPACERATQIEPDFADGWLEFIARAITQGKPAKAMQGILGYEKQFNRSLRESDLSPYEGFAKLKTSVEYRAWIKTKR